MKTNDILVNFKQNIYEFYEWNKADNIENIKSILCFKISDKMFNDIYKNTIKVNSCFLKQIECKTEVFMIRDIKLIDYACVFYNNYSALAVEFGTDGIMIGKSRLLLDEEDEIVTNGINNEVVSIDYDIIKKTNQSYFLTRKEQKMVDILNKYIDNIKDNEDEIKYVYFECFEDNENDLKKAILKIKYYINKADKNVLNKLKILIKVLKK